MANQWLWFEGTKFAQFQQFQEQRCSSWNLTPYLFLHFGFCNFLKFGKFWSSPIGCPLFLDFGEQNLIFLKNLKHQSWVESHSISHGGENFYFWQFLGSSNGRHWFSKFWSVWTKFQNMANPPPRILEVKTWVFVIWHHTFLLDFRFDNFEILRKFQAFLLAALNSSFLIFLFFHFWGSKPCPNCKLERPIWCRIAFSMLSSSKKSLLDEFGLP